MTVEEAIKWTNLGWVVGSKLEGRVFWMQWLHGSSLRNPWGPLGTNNE